MPSPLFYFGVKRGSASDSGTKPVGEAIDHFEREGNVSTLRHDFVFFSKADDQAEVITGVRKAFEEVLEVVVTMGNQSCFVGKQNFSEENLAEFGF